MTYRPKSESGKARALSVLLAVGAVILFAVSAFVRLYQFYYQITALAFAVISIELFMKYVGSDYVYQADERSIKVYRVTGKKSICVCSLDYSCSVTMIMTGEEYKADKNKYPKYNFMVNYCKNLAPGEYSVYMFEFNGKRSLMKFEPDAQFVNYTNEYISAAMKDKENN